MSKLEIVLHAALGVLTILAIAAVAPSLDSDARSWLAGGLGIASSIAWAASAFVFGRPRLAARISFFAAVLAGCVCVIAVAPVQPTTNRTSVEVAQP